MTTQNDLQQLAGATVHSTDGDKIGSVGQIYLDNDTNQPAWVTVKTGLFGTKQTFVPLDKANISGDRIEVPFGKDQVKNAPQIDEDGDLSPDDEDRLYTHYGLASTSGYDSRGNAGDNFTGRETGDARDTSSARDTGYDGGNDAGRADDDAMTRSEERLVAGTRTERAGTARLRKHVVTEQQQVNVPVSREEVRLEREPITDANVDTATRGPDISESEHEVTLHAERPVVETEAVPVERVRLNKETVTDQQNVSGEVRKEQIDFDDDNARDRS
jgi:uncharacterized protein (TIGR02271 family)